LFSFFYFFSMLVSIGIGQRLFTHPSTADDVPNPRMSIRFQTFLTCCAVTPEIYHSVYACHGLIPMFCGDSSLRTLIPAFFNSPPTFLILRKGCLRFFFPLWSFFPEPFFHIPGGQDPRAVFFASFFCRRRSFLCRPCPDFCRGRPFTPRSVLNRVAFPPSSIQLSRVRFPCPDFGQKLVFFSTFFPLSFTPPIPRQPF